MRKFFIILLFAFTGWAFCGAIMGIGMSTLSLQTTLIFHAIGAPLIFAVLAWIYFKRFNYTTPLQTAGIFLGFVIFLDVFVVALLVEHSFEMFRSVLGTWIPLVLIFSVTYLVGMVVREKT